MRRLAADLKAVGARNATAGRLKGLTGPRKFAAMEAAYESHRREGRLPATYEVVFGQAWAPAALPRRAGGEERTRLARANEARPAKEAGLVSPTPHRHPKIQRRRRLRSVRRFRGRAGRRAQVPGQMLQQIARVIRQILIDAAVDFSIHRIAQLLKVVATCKSASGEARA